MPARPSPPRPPALGAWFAAAALVGCAATSFDGRVYRGDGFAFQVPSAPVGWRRLDATGAALAFRDDDHAATIAVNGRCGLDGEDVPLAALTRHLFLQFTEREPKSEEVVPFDGREAMHSVLEAKLDGVPASFDVWVLKKDGCVYDFVYLAPPERFAEGVETFRGFVGGFRTLPPEAP